MGEHDPSGSSPGRAGRQVRDPGVRREPARPQVQPHHARGRLLQHDQPAGGVAQRRLGALVPGEVLPGHRPGPQQRPRLRPLEDPRARRRRPAGWCRCRRTGGRWGGGRRTPGSPGAAPAWSRACPSAAAAPAVRPTPRPGVTRRRRARAPRQRDRRRLRSGPTSGAARASAARPPTRAATDRRPADDRAPADHSRSATSIGGALAGADRAVHVAGPVGRGLGAGPVDATERAAGSPGRTPRSRRGPGAPPGRRRSTARGSSRARCTRSGRAPCRPTILAKPSSTALRALRATHRAVGLPGRPADEGEQHADGGVLGRVVEAGAHGALGVEARCRRARPRARTASRRPRRTS